MLTERTVRCAASQEQEGEQSPRSTLRSSRGEGKRSARSERLGEALEVDVPSPTPLLPGAGAGLPSLRPAEPKHQPSSFSAASPQGRP